MFWASTFHFYEKTRYHCRLGLTLHIYYAKDRKIDLHFQTKSFLYQFSPGEWSFGVHEDILGRDQILDFTDDLTGEPHDVARENIPMYVNEVGYSPDLKQTVFAAQPDDRNVHYYVSVEEPMKRGDKIELLVNYASIYETTRERQGYGLKNINGKTQGDQHLPSRLARNLIERRDLVADIKETSLTSFYMLLEFCHAISQKLHVLMEEFLAAESRASPSFVSPLSSLQLVAVRRLCWLSTVFQQRYEELKVGHTTAYNGQSPIPCMLAQCQTWISELSWKRWASVFQVIDQRPKLQDKNGRVLLEELEFEAVEEISHCTGLVMPMQLSRWCPLAIQLTTGLCKVAARTLWLNAEKKGLASTFLCHAIGYGKIVDNPPNLGWLSFATDFQDPFVAYQAQESRVGANKPPVLVVLKQNTDASSAPATHLEATAMAMGTQNVIIHKSWYKYRQILFLVHTIAKYALAGEPTYSWDNLVSTVGLDLNIAAVARSQPISPPSEEANQQSTPRRRRKRENSSAQGTKPRRSAEPGSSSRGMFFWQIVWPCLRDKLGWRLEKGNRAQDFYALPRGVSRGCGAKPRVDFFDSVPLSKCMVSFPHAGH